jgi:hypothetical protein
VLPSRPRLLLVSMYPLDQGLWGPIVRITSLRDELSTRVDLDLVSGYRGQRRGELARYAFSGRLRGLAGVYVESSTFLPAEADIAFLALARSLGIPVLTYVRDAYQLFPEYYPMTTLRRRVAAQAFVPAFRALAAVSTDVAFPSRGLADVVLGKAADAVIIPPGEPAPVAVPRSADARRLLFVGNGTLEAQGARRLITAVGIARDQGVDAELTIVSRPGEAPPPPHPAWLRLVQAEGSGITALLPDTVATVIPRPRSRYNDLALPVKLFDYLALGRPLLVTDCTEQAAIVADAGAGLVVSDDDVSLADGVSRMLSAEAAQLDRWSDRAREAALQHAWHERATTILETLGIPA